MSATAPFLPPPGTRCFRCNKDHSTAEAFLMACGKCERAWHHRCHIPPVLEQEIMGRIRADEKGKRNRGLGSWQCRLCTKKSRTEPSSVAQSAQPAIIPSTSAAHTVITIDDDDDDDIIILDGPPTQPVPTQAQLPSTLAPQHQAANDSTSPSGTSSVDHPSYGGIPARSTTLSSSSQASFSSTKPTATPDAVRPSEPSSKGKTRSLPVAIDSFGQPAPTVVSPPLGDTPTPSSEPSRMQEKGKEKERPLPRVTKRVAARAAPVVTPLTEDTSTGSAPRTQHTQIPPSTRLRSSSPRPSHQSSGQGDLLATPRRHPLAAPPPARTPSPPPSTIVFSPQSIRALIADMRAQGRLAPPPTIEYVNDRRRDDQVVHDGRTSKRVTSRPRKPTPLFMSSDSSEEDADMRDSMDVDAEMSAPEAVPQSNSKHEPEPPPSPHIVPKVEEDPHNIDDLYGEIAPAYRTPPPPRLLYMDRDNGPSPDDELAHIFEKMARVEEQRNAASGAAPLSVRPRKTAARKLYGKELAKVKKGLICFCQTKPR